MENPVELIAKEEDTRWEETLSSLPFGVAVVDRAGNIQRANQSLLALNGIQSHPISLWELIPEADHDLWEDVLKTVFEGQSRELEWARRGENGTQCFLTTISPLSDPGSASIAIVDVTARYRLEESLAEYASFLKERDEEIEKLLYIVSHDLKTPLSSISGFFELLVDELDEQTVTRTAKLIAGTKRSVGRMHDLIRDLLEVSLADKALATTKPVDVADVATSVLGSFSTILEDQGIEARMALSLPVVRCTPNRLAQVLENLVGNAIKYMGNPPHRSIEIGWLFDAEEQPLYVRDSGMGIDPSDHKRIFQIFRRAAASPGEGTGIGLTVCERIVNSHGGRMWLESQPGAGSTFYFTLPIVQKRIPTKTAPS